MWASAILKILNRKRKKPEQKNETILPMLCHGSAAVN